MLPISLHLLLPISMSAQSRESGAQAAVAAVFAAQDDADVLTLVSLVHPEAMVAFKQRQLDQDAMFDQARSGLGNLSDSTSPEAQAMAAEFRRPRKTLLQVVFKVRDRTEFERLTPEQVLTRWFLMTTQQREPEPGFPGELPKRQREILGEVPDRDGLVHVVFRESWIPDSYLGIPERREPQIRVISAQETTGGWRVMLNGGLVYDEGGGWGIGWNDEDETSPEGK
jgi:hypothetical protein